MNTSCETKESCREKLMRRLRASLPGLIGAALGTLGGWLYYREVGCSSGSCAITSNPWASMIWGALLGYFIGDLFQSKKPKTENHEKKYGDDR